MFRNPRTAAASLATLLFAGSAFAGGTITGWSATSSVEAKTIWMVDGTPVAGDSCTADTTYSGTFPVDDLICCSAAVGYGNAGSCANLSTVVNLHNLTTDAAISSSVAWANQDNQDVLVAQSSFEQVAQIAVDSNVALHLTGALEAVPQNWATVRVEDASGVLVEHSVSWFDTLDLDEIMSLAPGQYQLTLSLAGTPGVSDFRALWGEATLSVTAILVPVVGVEPRSEGWARIKALYR